MTTEQHAATGGPRWRGNALSSPGSLPTAPRRPGRSSSPAHNAGCGGSTWTAPTRQATKAATRKEQDCAASQQLETNHGTHENQEDQLHQILDTAPSAVVMRESASAKVTEFVVSMSREDWVCEGSREHSLRQAFRI
jgi:hypothetical protein